MKTHKLNYLASIFFTLALFAGTAQAADVQLNEQVDCSARVKLPDVDGKLEEKRVNFAWIISGTAAEPQFGTSLTSTQIMTKISVDADFDKMNTALYNGPMFDQSGNLLSGEGVGGPIGLRFKVLTSKDALSPKEHQVIFSYSTSLKFLSVDEEQANPDSIVCTRSTPI
jgi:hypothetical protein